MKSDRRTARAASIRMGALLVLLAFGLAACGSASASSSGPSTTTAPSAPGSIVSATAMVGPPAGTRGWRILYRTTTASGEPAVSSGTVYTPAGPAPPRGRFVVAWAHPTLGTGTACTPSHAADPAEAIPGFAAMMKAGWVVTSTDYTGLGTPGVLPYLIGSGEARNVLDSVRAADNLAGTGAGRTFAVWGHSQGGHASLFTPQVATTYAPTLHLVGVAAAAPAAELPALIEAQWNQAVAWVIGSEVIGLWPGFYSDLKATQVATPLALANYQRLGAFCITGETSQLASEFAPYFAKPFFSADPTAIVAWRTHIDRNTPSAPKVPVFVSQGLADTVVLPSTTSLLEDRWCASGTRITVDWIPGATHFTVPSLSASAAVDWLAARFEGKPAPSSCTVKPPTAPAVNPPPAGKMS
jgi:alpha-beta hydrolase superfamily lysophospholipase